MDLWGEEGGEALCDLEKASAGDPETESALLAPAPRLCLRRLPGPSCQLRL